MSRLWFFRVFKANIFIPLQFIRYLESLIVMKFGSFHNIDIDQNIFLIRYQSIHIDRCSLCLGDDQKFVSNLIIHQ